MSAERPGDELAWTVEPASPEIIRWVWTHHWGGAPVITPLGERDVSDVAGISLTRPRGETGGRGEDGPALDRAPVLDAGAVCGLLTWAPHRAPLEVEVVSVDALVQGVGVGSRLLARAEALLARQGFREVVLFTTNDNLAALGFYLRRGYRLVGVHPDFLRQVRARKPQVPERGAGGIPLQDMWELRKRLASERPP